MANPLNHRTVHTNAFHFFEIRLVQNWWNRLPSIQRAAELVVPPRESAMIVRVFRFLSRVTLSVEGTDYICMYMLYSMQCLHWQRECPQVSIAWFVTSDNFMKVPKKKQGECILQHPDLSPDNLTIMTWGMWRDHNLVTFWDPSSALLALESNNSRQFLAEENVLHPKSSFIGCQSKDSW